VGSRIPEQEQAMSKAKVMRYAVAGIMTLGAAAATVALISVFIAMHT
jgi:hypothetical protein